MFEPIHFKSQKYVASPTHPIHFLSANDLLNVVNWLGSIWDVFNYFKLRQHVSHMFDGINIERELLCYYTLRSREDFSGFAGADRVSLRELHQLFLIDTLPKYAERDMLAGYVNVVIHQLHDRDKDFESYAPPELKHMIEPVGKRNAYLSMAATLNSLPMSNKAWIGQQIKNGIKIAKETGQSNCFLYRQLLGKVAFVFAIFTGFTRTEKIRALNLFLPAAQYSSGMIESFGVAFDADDENMGFEVLWRRGPVEKSDTVREIATQLFGSSFETFSPTPFGEPRPYTPKGQRTGT
jgi:hypothetical protein